MATVLIVEDSPIEAKLLSDCLQQSGFEVMQVTTAEAGRAVLDKTRIDGIILDVVLPGQSGFSFCRDVKQDETTADIPIIMCSSKSEKIDKKWGIRQGANAYLTKPFDAQEMVDTVRQHLN
jgi:twitching motility two-component system response regulator PilH/chemotaxis family two-component system response regulator PixH